VYRQMSINAVLRIGRRNHKTEVHKGGEGLHCTVVPLKEEEEEEEEEEERKKKKNCC